MADWSMLPNDLLGEIALKLDTIEDFIYFSAVCHSWNYAYCIVKNELKSKKTMPWLVLPENPNNNSNKRKIFNVSNNKCYQLSMPEINGARCWGSSHGWIVLQTFDKHLHLFNPLTKDRITNLPSLLETELASKQDDNTWFWKHYVSRVVVMKMVDHNNNKEELVVALIYLDYLCLARQGDQSWKFIAECVEDVTCCGNILYFITWDKSLHYYDIYEIGDDIDGICNNFTDYVRVEKDYYLTSNPDRFDWFNRYYILNSVDDDILMINRFKENVYDPIDPDYFDHFIVYGTYRFDVYKLDPLRRKLNKIRDLDNLALFVGDNTAFSVCASPSNNYTPNCIYFTDDASHSWDMVIDFGGHDMGVFHMDSEEITQFYHGGDEDVRSEFCPPFFFNPSF